jgi:hypothetical protein
MSHISKINVEIKALEILKAACQRLGYQFVPNQCKYKWYGVNMGDYPLPEGLKASDLGKCTHAIKVPGADYEVGVVQQGNKYTLLYDFWPTGGLTGVGDKLAQAYAVEAARTEAQRQGYSVWEEILQDDSVQLHIEVQEG